MLLPAEEVDRITALAPPSLTQWQDAVAQNVTPRPEMRQWLDLFDAAAAQGMCDPPTPTLYELQNRASQKPCTKSGITNEVLRRTATA